MASLFSEALSWLVVVTIGLAPMLVYWLAQVIGRALRRKAPRPPAGNLPTEIEKGERGKARLKPPVRRNSRR